MILHGEFGEVEFAGDSVGQSSGDERNQLLLADGGLGRESEPRDVSRASSATHLKSDRHKRGGRQPRRVRQADCAENIGRGIFSG